MMQIYDTEKYNTSICAMRSADNKSVYVSFGKGSLSSTLFIGKEAARELADSILEVVEELDDCDNNAQTLMPFMAEEAA